MNEFLRGNSPFSRRYTMPTTFSSTSQLCVFPYKEKQATRHRLCAYVFLYLNNKRVSRLVIFNYRCKYDKAQKFTSVATCCLSCASDRMMTRCFLSFESEPFTKPRNFSAILSRLRSDKLFFPSQFYIFFFVSN